MGTLFETALIVGGASRDRTGDLYNAIVALSQLSYGPTAGRRGRLRADSGFVKHFCRLPWVTVNHIQDASTAS